MREIGLILDVLGAVLIVLNFIRSRQEIKDQASSWWDGNPFYEKSEIRLKYFGVVGLHLLIAGFALQFSSQITLPGNVDYFKWIVAANIFLFFSLVFVLFSIWNAHVYIKKRKTHFAKLARDTISNPSLNQTQKENSLKSYGEELCEDRYWSILDRKDISFEEKIQLLDNYLNKFR